MITRYWTGSFFVSGQCLVHTHCFACWLLLRSSLFCVVNDNDFVFFCLCLSLRRSTEKASILLRFWDLMQPGVKDGMIPDFCILNCCAAASYYRTALYIWKHPSARLPSRNTVSHCNDSVYTHTENVNIICKTGCGQTAKKAVKKAEKRPWHPHEKRVSDSRSFEYELPTRMWRNWQTRTVQLLPLWCVTVFTYIFSLYFLI